jgi:HAD superfamily hydrolase (TIGR01490 family)
MTEPVAIFDLEGTLCARGGTLIWREIVKSRFRRGLASGEIIMHVLSQLLIALLHRLGLFSTRKARLSGIKKVAVLFSGFSQEELDQLAGAISLKLVARLRSDVYAILQEHKRLGHRLVLLSGTFQPILEAIGRELGVQTNIGTRLEKKDGWYTGRLSGPICFDEQKASVLKEFIKENHLEVDFSRSYAYGDAMSDKPMLELVGNPVAVYPDAELRAHAQQHGWKIIG